MGNVLADVREEQFCQFLVAGGLPPRQAATQAGYPPKKNLKKLLALPRIQSRLTELNINFGRQIAKTKEQILNRVYEIHMAAHAAGQHAAALRGLEMYGQETHGMFRKQLEIGRAGEFDQMDETQLRQFIADKMKELGVETAAPVLIEDHSEPQLSDVTADK